APPPGATATLPAAPGGPGAPTRPATPGQPATPARPRTQAGPGTATRPVTSARSGAPARSDAPARPGAPSRSAAPPSPTSPPIPTSPSAPTSPPGRVTPPGLAARSAPAPRPTSGAPPAAPAGRPGGPARGAAPTSPPPRPAAPGQPASAPGTTRAGSRWTQQRSKWWYVAFAAAVGVLTLFTAYGVAAYRLVQDELDARQALGQQPATTAPVPRDISSREADPEPLTVDEVFPDDEIVINPAEDPYRVLAAKSDEDCTVAAVDALGELLKEYGCNQVVRGTLRSPDKDYLITGGIFNLDRK